MIIKPLFRVCVIGAVLAAATGVVYWQLAGSWHWRALEERDRIIAEMEQRLAQREAMLERLSRSRRMGRIEILHQTLDASGAPLETTARFIELDDRGREIGRQQFTLPGGVLFIDAWTAKFSHEDVAAGNPLRGRTIVLLRRFYSEELPPRDGIPIDTPGAIPDGYAATEAAAFERRVWEQFWQIAGDPEASARFHIRVAQGEAVYKPVRAGQAFDFSVDAAGGINLAPLRPIAAAGRQNPPQPQ